MTVYFNSVCYASVNTNAITKGTCHSYTDCMEKNSPQYLEKTRINLDRTLSQYMKTDLVDESEK